MKILRRCKCGCGSITKPGNRYINGHNSRGIKLSSEVIEKRIITFKLNKKLNKKKVRSKCACGCGDTTERGRNYIHGHNNKGMVFSEGSRTKISKSLMGKVRSIESRKKQSKTNKGKICSEETRKKMSESHKGKRFSKERKINISISQMKCRTDGYCDAWSDKEYKDDLRKSACSSCEMTIEESLEKWGRRLGLHHKDGNKKNCSPDNFDTLCVSCHAIADWELRRQKEINNGSA